MIASLTSWWRARGARVPHASAPRWLAAGALRGTAQGARVVSDPTRTVRLAFVAPAERAQARGERSALLARAQTALAVIFVGVVVALWLGWLVDGAPRVGAAARWMRSEHDSARVEPEETRAPTPPARASQATTRIEVSPTGAGIRELHVLTLADLPDITLGEVDPCVPTVRLSDVPSVSARR